MLDTVRKVETPEGVELELCPAGPMARSVALLLDLLVMGGGLMLALIPMAMLGPIGMGLWFILAFLGYWLYPVLFEMLGNGQTLGKRAMGLRVLMSNGLPVTWEASLLRNLLRLVDGLPGAYTIGLLSVMLSPDYQRVGDLVAGTLVVHIPRPAAALPLPDIEPVHPPLALSLEEQGALLSFGERTARLNPARCEELADILVDLTGERGPSGVRTLQGMARWIRGEASGPLTGPALGPRQERP